MTKPGASSRRPMRLEARHSQRLEQRLLPQMLQSIEILQLATADLMQLVAQQMETNEALEMLPPGEPESVERAVDDARSRAESEWESNGVRQSGDEVDGRRALLENQAAPVDALLDEVRLQAVLRELDPSVTEAVSLLAERLDERGLLPERLEDVAAASGLALDVLQSALRELQTMEPRGLGAGTGIEAMLLQAAGDPDYARIETLLRNHLEALAANKWPEVARALQLEVGELADLVERIKDLSPAPGEGLRSRVEAPITADVAVWTEDGELFVALAEDGVPQLAVNELYASMAKDRAVDAVVREHLKGRVRAARELMDAIAHRQSTLLRVTRAIFERQREFLQRGRAGLRPLRMTDLAGELGIHASTVSRAIAGKYVATAKGTLPLRDFCVGGTGDGKAAAGHARTAVAQRLAELVDAEDKSEPLSDDAMVEKLAEQGIEVARRTVAKLRDELGIASSYRRRQHGDKRA